MKKRLILALACVCAVMLAQGCVLKPPEVDTIARPQTQYSDAFLQQYCARLRSAANYSFTGRMSVQQGDSASKCMVNFTSRGNDCAMSLIYYDGKSVRYIWADREQSTVDDQSGQVMTSAFAGEVLYDIQKGIQDANILKKTVGTIGGVAANIYELTSNGKISEQAFDSNGDLLQSKYFDGGSIIIIDYFEVLTGESDENMFVIPKDFKSTSDEFETAEGANVELPKGYPLEELPPCTGARLIGASSEMIGSILRVTTIYDTWLDAESAVRWYSDILEGSEDYNIDRFIRNEGIIADIKGSIKGWNVREVGIEKAQGNDRTKIKIIITQ